jgi:thymidylate synthase
MINQLYADAIRALLAHGKSGASPRGSAIKEVPNVTLMLDDARDSIITHAVRKVHLAYATIEMLGNLRHGDKNVEPYCWYNPNMQQYLNPETHKWDGSYATRITMYDQLRAVYKILKEDPYSRRAVISMYNPAHDLHDYVSLDVPCTLTLIFQLRDGKLNLTGTMRSNDVLLGLPYDLTQFTFLQSVLAGWLGVEVGWYFHLAANMHAYIKDLPKLELIAADTAEYPEQRMPTWDIPDPDETYAQVERFFKLDYEARISNAKLTPSAVYRLFARHEITSNTLRDLFVNVLAPYIRKKKDKAGK